MLEFLAGFIVGAGVMFLVFRNNTTKMKNIGVIVENAISAKTPVEEVLQKILDEIKR